MWFFIEIYYIGIGIGIAPGTILFSSSLSLSLSLSLVRIIFTEIIVGGVDDVDVNFSVVYESKKKDT